MAVWMKNALTLHRPRIFGLKAEYCAHGNLYAATAVLTPKCVSFAVSSGNNFHYSWLLSTVTTKSFRLLEHFFPRFIHSFMMFCFEMWYWVINFYIALIASRINLFRISRFYRESLCFHMYIHIIVCDNQIVRFFLFLTTIKRVISIASDCRCLILSISIIFMCKSKHPIEINIFTIHSTDFCVRR